MAKRDILDYQGNKVGELQEPSGVTWTEEQWAEKLSKYSQPPSSELIPDVTPRQIRQALVLSGVSMAQIETALDALQEPTKSLAKIEWEYSTLFIRSNQLVAQVGFALGWTSTQLDNLWKFAKTL